MLKKKTINIPSTINYIDDWKEFDSLIPNGQVIINKNYTGIGLTNHYLSNDMPIIEISPRISLIQSKEMDKRLAEKGIRLFTFYGDGSKPETKSKKLDSYIQESRANNPFISNEFTPKIIVTSDSFELLKDILEKDFSDCDLFSKFTIIVDEMHTIISDTVFKGNVEIKLLNLLGKLKNNIIYLSATPPSDIYLEQIDEFKDLNYINLIMDPTRVEEISLTHKPMINTRTEVSNIINDFKKNGYFQAKIVDGKTIYSKEALFFLNNIHDIVAIINQCDLKKDEVNIICSDRPENNSLLRKKIMSNEKFSIGHVRGENEIDSNPPYTFITSVSFEGSDIFSNTATTYVFSNANSKTLALDISISLPQIVGRCRTKSNPFRNEIFFYYQTTNSKVIDKDLKWIIDEDEFKNIIKFKLDSSDRALKTYSNADDIVLDDAIIAQRSNKYKKHYIDIIEENGKRTPIFNKLAYVADMRAFDIYNNQYCTKYQVVNKLEDSGFSTTSFINSKNKNILDLYDNLMKNKNFNIQMHLYIETVEKDDNLKSSIEKSSMIPYKFKQFYNIIGSNRLHEIKSYREKDLKKEMIEIINEDNIRCRIQPMFKKGMKITNKQAKDFLSLVYKSAGIKKNAKAIDIKKYINAREIQFKVGSKMYRGFEIL